MKRFITLGEIMLRLTPPNYELIRAATGFEAHYGGSEANIALSLANLGIDSSFFSVVPDNPLGKSAVQMLRGNKVNCSPVILSTPEETPTHRLGTYYLETGFGPRPSQVIYDRKHSAITEYDLSGVNPETLLQGFQWLHMSGITPALSPRCGEFVLACLRKARELGLTVSFDGNFRSALWGWEEARDYCTRCMPYIDVLLGIEPFHLWRDEKDHSQGDIKDSVPMQPILAEQEEVFRTFVQRWPNLKCIARHVRYAPSSSENSLMAYLWMDGKTYESRRFTFPILDRVGGGDAFAAGLIYSMMNDYRPADVINFAVAASALKHTIHGDGSINDDANAIRALMDRNFDIHR